MTIMKTNQVQHVSDAMTMRPIGSEGVISGSRESGVATGKQLVPGGLLTTVIHLLARTIALLHCAIGITTLPPDATPRQERRFVLIWLGLILGIILWGAMLLYLIS